MPELVSTPGVVFKAHRNKIIHVIRPFPLHLSPLALPHFFSIIPYLSIRSWFDKSGHSSTSLDNNRHPKTSSFQPRLARSKFKDWKHYFNFPPSMALSSWVEFHLIVVSWSGYWLIIARAHKPIFLFENPRFQSQTNTTAFLKLLSLCLQKFLLCSSRQSRNSVERADMGKL